MDPLGDLKKIIDAKDGGAIGIEVLFTDKKAKGGRVGFQTGGWAEGLTGEAKGIYDSMTAYGASDAEIQAKLQTQGLWSPDGSGGGGGGTEQVTGIINQNIGGDNFSPYNPDPNKIQPVRDNRMVELGTDQFGTIYGEKPQSSFTQGIGKLLNNPVTQAIGAFMNPPLAFAKGLLSQAGSMMPVNERAIAENLAGQSGVRVDDLGRIVNTGSYNTPEGVMAGYNLNQVTDETFTDRISDIGNTLQSKYGLSKEQVDGLISGELTEEDFTDSKYNLPGTNKTTNLITQIRNVKLAQDNIMGQKATAAKMAQQQREAKEREDARKIQQSGLTDLGNIKKIQQYTGQPLSDYRASRPSSERNYTGHGKSGMGRDRSELMASGGRAGLASMFTRRR
jgi:hypothetical protein